MIGWDRRIAVLEATVGFLKDRLIAIEATIISNAESMSRKVDKLENSLGRQDEHLEKMHNQNQAWIRSVAYGIIMLLIYGLWEVLHTQLGLK